MGLMSINLVDHKSDSHSDTLVDPFNNVRTTNFMRINFKLMPCHLDYGIQLYIFFAELLKKNKERKRNESLSMFYSLLL